MRAQTHRKPDNNRHKRLHTTLIVVTVLLIIGGAVIVVLNTEKTISGPWSDILGPSSTALGLILSLFQIVPLNLLLQSPARDGASSRSPVTKPAGKQVIPGPEEHHSHIIGMPTKIRKGKGMLVVYARKNLRGETIDLSRGFDVGQFTTHVATNIVERNTSDGRTLYIGIFPELDPDNYIACISSKQKAARVTVLTGQIAEIDWR
jgi:hypothetical protein